MLKPKDVNLVIAHGNCPDGLGAAWAARKMHGDNIEYYFESYGSEKYPDVTGKNVLMVDFAYKSPEIMNDLNSKANSMLLLDHHKTAKEILEGKIDCDHIFDMNRSGARMAWDFFFPKRKAPNLIAYIEDRDLWKWEFRESREYLAALNSYPQTFETYDWVFSLDNDNDDYYGLEDFMSEGRAIVRCQKQMVENAVKKAAKGLLIAPDGENYKCSFLNSATLELVSDIGHELAKESGIGLVWGYSHKDSKMHCSLRSIGEIDVSKIANKFGGGGHRNASGFEFKGKIEDMLYAYPE